MDSSEFRSSRRSTTSDVNRSMNLEQCITKLINNVGPPDADHQPPRGPECRQGPRRAVPQRGHPHQLHGRHLLRAERDDRPRRGVRRKRLGWRRRVGKLHLEKQKTTKATTPISSAWCRSMRPRSGTTYEPSSSCDSTSRI